MNKANDEHKQSIVAAGIIFLFLSCISKILFSFLLIICSLFDMALSPSNINVFE